MPVGRSETDRLKAAVSLTTSGWSFSRYTGKGLLLSSAFCRKRAVLMTPHTQPPTAKTKEETKTQLSTRQHTHHNVDKKKRSCNQKKKNRGGGGEKKKPKWNRKGKKKKKNSKKNKTKQSKVLSKRTEGRTHGSPHHPTREGERRNNNNNNQSSLTWWARLSTEVQAEAPLLLNVPLLCCLCLLASLHPSFLSLRGKPSFRAQKRAVSCRRGRKGSGFAHG